MPKRKRVPVTTGAIKGKVKRIRETDSVSVDFDHDRTSEIVTRRKTVGEEPALALDKFRLSTPNAESTRLREAAEGVEWRLWGPYLSERQWATVREDDSQIGNCWEHFPHHLAASRAYQWGEDGLLGVCDSNAQLCLALALWNGKDEMLKERLFGLTGPQGNHGEDVKECYYYLDSLPSHAYMKALYKYPQAAFPYDGILRENMKKGIEEPEYEILDTGIFQEEGYWDVLVEYAKAGPTDLACQYTVHNRSSHPADIHLIPQLWFRNVWSWGGKDVKKPKLKLDGELKVCCSHDELGHYIFEIDNGDDGATPELLFTENETAPDNELSIGPCVKGSTMREESPTKDAFHKYIVQGCHNAVSSTNQGTKFGAHYRFRVPGEGQITVSCRLYRESKPPCKHPILSIGSLMALRREEADQFYHSVIPKTVSSDVSLVMRQAYAGLCWTKQFFFYDVSAWLKGRKKLNQEWAHMVNKDVISMPDKWEFPWYATWDLAFQMIPFSDIDIDFAKEQLLLFLSDRYMHPNGQLPAYEFNFSDVNPPVHAWACWSVYCKTGLPIERDTTFLKRCFHKLIINYNWWVNQKAVAGSFVFGGGFLGLDNISCIDRSHPPKGTTLLQVDGTSWMAFYSLFMMRIAVELAKREPSYQDLACMYLQQFVSIAGALNNNQNGRGLWSSKDHFYYDQMVTEDDQYIQLPVRTLVGLSALFGVCILQSSDVDHIPQLVTKLQELTSSKSSPQQCILVNEGLNGEKKYLLSLVNREKLVSLLHYMLDPEEFLSSYGIRSFSAVHKSPIVVEVNGELYSARYCPGESNSGMFGGNSNWRGPVWICMNYLLIESLEIFGDFYGEYLQLNFPSNTSSLHSLGDICVNLRHRISRIFLPDEEDCRPCHGYTKSYQDEHWQKLVLFYEYFDGNTGRGCGASHQTGWTALIASVMQKHASTLSS